MELEQWTLTSNLSAFRRLMKELYWCGCIFVRPSSMFFFLWSSVQIWIKWDVQQETNLKRIVYRKAVSRFEIDFMLIKIIVQFTNIEWSIVRLHYYWKSRYFVLEFKKRAGSFCTDITRNFEFNFKDLWSQYFGIN